MFLASSGPLGGPLEDLLGRLGALLDRLEAILGHLGTVLDGLGVSWSALGPSWSPLGPHFGASWGYLGPSGALLGPSWAPGGRLDHPRRASPLPWAPPFRASPLLNVTRSYLALSVTWAGTETERAPSGTCPRWLMAPFALGSLAVQSLLRHRSLLGALVSRDVYVAARSWEPWCRELFK